MNTAIMTKGVGTLANLNLFLIYFFLFAGGFGFFSLLANARGIALLPFWAFPLGAFSPWLLIIGVVSLLTELEGYTPRAQAMGMSMLFPLLGSIGCCFLGTILALFLATQEPFWIRFLWGAGVSSVPALITAIVLVVAFASP